LQEESPQQERKDMARLSEWHTGHHQAKRVAKKQSHDVRDSFYVHSNRISKSSHLSFQYFRN
jgi:hypothetical protein